MQHTRLLADIGGTNVRLAWQAGPGGALRDLWARPCARFASLEAAIRAYVAETGISMPQEAALGIAYPVAGDAVHMTNRDWSFSQSALRAALGLRRLVVLNDFTALALAIPLLTPQMLRQVGGGAPVAGAAVGLLGPGTGLGVSGLVFAPDGTDIPLAGEGGHATLAAQTPLEWELLCVLQRRYGHVSAERVLCGQGLVDLYHALRELAGLGACRTWSVESENRRFHQNRPQRGQFLPDLQRHSPAMGQKDGEKWTAAADLQPTISTSDRLLAAGPRPRLAWRLHGALFFGAAAKIDPIVQAVEAGPEGPEVVLNARDLFALDTTGLEGLEQILKAVGQRGGVLCVQDAQEQPRSLMERSGFNARLAAQNAAQHRKSY